MQSQHPDTGNGPVNQNDIQLLKEKAEDAERWLSISAEKVSAQILLETQLDSGRTFEQVETVYNEFNERVEDPRKAAFLTKQFLTRGKTKEELLDRHNRFEESYPDSILPKQDEGIHYEAAVRLGASVKDLEIRLIEMEDVLESTEEASSFLFESITPAAKELTPEQIKEHIDEIRALLPQSSSYDVGTVLFHVIVNSFPAEEVVERLQKTNEITGDSEASMILETAILPKDQSYSYMRDDLRALYDEAFKLIEDATLAALLAAHALKKKMEPEVTIPPFGPLDF